MKNKNYFKKLLLALVMLVGFTNFVNAQVMVSTLAGSTTGGDVDGIGSVARFGSVRGICMSSGNILVTDDINDKIRKITSSGIVTSLQVSGDETVIPPVYFSTYCARQGICRDLAGNLYMICGKSITKITASGKIIGDFVGVNYIEGYVDGTAANARFYNLSGICIDPSGNLFVTEAYSARVRKITPEGVVSTFVTGAEAFNGICADASGNVYFTSSFSGKIFKATPAGIATLVAGGGSGASGYADGAIGAKAYINNPNGICIDAIGNLYVTTDVNIRKITPAGAVTTFAGFQITGGTGQISGYLDGEGTNARFNRPWGICTDNLGNFYVSERMNNCVRKISVIPAFSQVAPICSGAPLAALPTTSVNGISGTWLPALNNSATTKYTFTPTGGNGISTTMTITVTPNTTPTFSQVAAVCNGASLVALPTTSSNSITGVWSPALNNSATTAYTFTPTTGICATTSTMNITVNPLPAVAGTISGNATICQGQNAVTYTVPTIANTSSYLWSLPSGATGTSTTNTITVNYGTSAVSGNIIVKGNNICGNGLTSTLPITVNPLPAVAGIITGSTTVCKGQNGVTYTVPIIANATSYTWTLPTGATGTSTTNSIIVNYDSSAVSGNIQVKGNNSCGDGVASSLSIIINSIPVSAGTISGSSSVCQGQNAVNYTVPLISGASSYAWSLPNGVTGTSSTNSITINFSTSAVSAGIEVYGQNSCGNGNSSIIAVSVNSNPSGAGTISGVTTVCQGQNAVTYTVPSITAATSYSWTLPTGATGTSTSNSITVNYGNSAVSGNITVKGNNSCGDGTSSSLAITVNALPSNAGTISGSATVCQGQASVFYAVPSIANTTSYVWTLPSGATGTSTSNSITVNYGNSAVSGNISVKGKNSCGNGVFSTLAVSVNNTLPPTGNILQNFTEGQTLSNIEITGTNLIWYGNLPDATNQINSIGNTTLLINDTTYYVTQTNNDCESAPFAITVTVALGLNTYSKGAIKLFPNPTHSILHLSVNKGTSVEKVTIVDITGKVVVKQTKNLSTINVEQLAKGVYILTAYAGDKKYQEKFIKE